MDIFIKKTIGKWRLRIASILGWTLFAINSPEVNRLIRPDVEPSDFSGLTLLIWAAGVILASWSTSGFAWNSLMKEGEHCLDDPPFDRSLGGRNSFERQLDSFVKGLKIARNGAFVTLIIGGLQVAYYWSKPYHLTCSLDNNDEISCSNDLAFAALFLMIGVVCLAMWGVYSQKLTFYLENIEPQIKSFRISKGGQE